MATKQIEDYLSLPYTIEISRDQGENYSGWFARVVELPGCMTEADSFEELGEMIVDAMRAWIETALEEEQTIPEPRQIEEYSGKFVVRVPKTLHRELVEIADREGTSLNSFIAVALGKTVGENDSRIKNLIITGEEIPVFPWPRLSEKAQRLLILNGMKQEIQDVNERMFADWIQDYLQQIQAAMRQDYYREALQYLQVLRQSIELLCDQSPLLTTYCEVVRLLEEQIKQNAQLREGLIEQTIIKSRISTQARMTTQYSIPTIESPKREFYLREPSKIREDSGEKLVQSWIEEQFEEK